MDRVVVLKLASTFGQASLPPPPDTQSAYARQPHGHLASRWALRPSLIPPPRVTDVGPPPFIGQVRENTSASE